MFQDNPLLAQLKQQMHSQKVRVEGTVKGTEKGFGFLEVDAQTSYFIPPPNMKKVMHGDKIVATLSTEKEREIAEPESLIEPFLSRFIARVQRKPNDSRLYLIPDHPLINSHILARSTSNIEPCPQSGDWVVAEMKYHPLRDERGFVAEITQYITKADDQFAPWWVTLARHQLERAAPDTTEVSLCDETHPRQDLTDLYFVTIDGASTEDMDDALYICDEGAGRLKLSIAIADPTAYVAENSELDLIARARGLTNYLPGFDIPMLPRQLSSGLCSLHPQQRRPAIVCTLNILADGSIDTNIEFCTAWVMSKAKLVYDNVSDWIEQKNSWQPEQAEVAHQIQLLQQFSTLRQQWRQQNALTFRDRPDYRFLLDEQGNVLNIVTDIRRSANRIVEESMIAANICAAIKLRDHLGYGLFSVHNGFDPAFIEPVINTLSEAGLEHSADNLLTLDGFCQLRRQLNAKPTTYLDSRIRRYQTFAEISTKPGPHFGLGLDVYATWTSPIRKYSDIVNHRLLKAIIKGEASQEPPTSLTQQLSDRRRLNRMAERDVADWLYTRYLQNSADVDKIRQAEIIDISKGGMRVRLLDIGAIAFIPASFIHATRDELICSQEKGQIHVNGEVIYSLGDSLNVAISEVREKNRGLIAKPIIS